MTGCGMCGIDPARGRAFINDTPYCHSDEQRPSCYERAQWEGRHLSSFTCPVCNRTSYNPKDIEEGYCGNCHAFTGDHGIREVTPEDRRKAVLHELLRSTSNVHITEGMVRRPRSWWQRLRDRLT